MVVFRHATVMNLASLQDAKISNVFRVKTAMSIVSTEVQYVLNKLMEEI